MHPILGWVTTTYAEDEPGEYWEEVPGYPQYQISNLKRVRNTKNNREIQHHFLKGKYPVVTVYRDKKQKQIRVNKVFKEIFGE